MPQFDTHSWPLDDRPQGPSRIGESPEFHWGAGPTDESIEWDRQEAERLATEVEALAERLSQQLTAASSGAEKFDLLHDFNKQRQQLRYGQMGVGSSYEASNKVFTVLSEQQRTNDSVYLRRMLEWLIDQEFHETFVDEDFQIQRRLLDGSKAEYYDYKEGNFEVVSASLSPDAAAYLADHPEYRAMFEYALESAKVHPHMSDMDYYAPSPYHSLYQEVKSLTTESDSFQKKSYQQELAIETAALFGVLPSELSDAAREQLFRYGVELDQETYARLDKVSDTMNPASRREFAEAFLATEFGDDFGSTLLSVAEKLDTAELAPFLESIQAVRHEAGRFAAMFTDFDKQLEVEVNHAIGERITEALYVLEELRTSDSGEASARVLGKRITVGSSEQIRQAIDYVATALRQINEDAASGDTTKSYASRSSSGWNLGETGKTLLQLKAHGSERGEHMKGVEHSEEAQVNFSVNVTDMPGKVPHEIADYRRRYALSIRIDLEGIIRDNNGGKIGFDATRDRLGLALDIGSMRAQHDNPNYIVGSVISLGNKLRRRRLAQGKSRGYHTTLDARYGDKEVFAGMVEYMKLKLLDRAFEQKRPISPAQASSLGRIAGQMSVSRSEKAAA